MVKKLLVTGSLGFMGKNLIERELFEREKIGNDYFEVLATDLENEIARNKGYIDKIEKEYAEKGKKINYVASDLTEKETLCRLMKGVDKIYHIAALYDYSAPWDLLYKVNVRGTENLLESALKAKQANVDHIVVWGSAAVFGCPKELNINEEAEKIPNLKELKKEYIIERRDYGWTDEKIIKKSRNSRYGISKREETDLAMSYSDLPVTVIYPSATYGEGSSYGIANYFFYVGGKNRFLRMLTKFAPPKNPLMQGSYVGDVIKAAVFLSEKEETIGQEYMVVDKEPVRLNDAVRLFAKEVGIWRPVVPAIPQLMKLVSHIDESYAKWKSKKTGKRVLARFPRDTYEYFFDDHTYSPEKLIKAGYKHVGSFEENMKKTIQWYKDNGYIVDKKKSTTEN